MGVVVIAIASSVVHAVDVNAPDEVRDDVVTVEPLLSEQTIVVAKFDMRRLDVPKLGELTGRPGPVQLLTSDGPVEDLDEGWMRTGIQATDEWLRAIRAASGGQPIYAIGEVPGRWPGPWNLFLTPASDGVDREALVRLLRAILVEPQAYGHAERLVVSSGDRESVAARLEHRVPSSRTELKEAFQAVARFPIKILFVPPDHLRRTVAELMPEVPDAWGGGSSEIWTEGVRWAAVGVDPGQMDAVLVVRSASEQAATRLGVHVEATLDQAIARIPTGQDEQAPWQWLLPLLRKQLVAERQDARWTIRFDDEPGSELGASLFVTAIAAVAQDWWTPGDFSKIPPGGQHVPGFKKPTAIEQ